MLALVIFLLVLVIAGSAIYTAVLYFEGSDDGEYDDYDNAHRGYAAWIYDVAFNGVSSAGTRRTKNLERNRAKRGK